MEKKIDIIDGTVTYNNQEYCFNYSNNRITLYPKELENTWKSIRTMFSNSNLKNDDNTINLYGETSTGNPIAFIKITSAFESEFDRAYPNYKTNTNVNYKRLKDN